MERKHWTAICRNVFLVLFLALCFIGRTPVASANYSIGLVGISAAVHGGGNNLNFNNYIDMKTRRDPIEYAQDVFTEIMMVQLSGSGLDPIDMTERADNARRDEMILQLAQGDTTTVVKQFQIKPDYLIYGGIANFTVSHRESLGSNNIAVETDLSVRIVDAANGKVVFVATGRGKSGTHDVDMGKNAKADKISEEAWHDSLEKALTQINDKIKKAV